MMHINNWVKGEVYCLEALVECANGISNCDNEKKRAIADIASLKDDIAKLNGGRFTFGGLLKDEAGKKQSAIEKGLLVAQLELDVQNYDILKKILVVYTALVAVATFKKKSTQRYIQAMGKMCDSEVHNANAVSDCWHSFKQLIDTHRIK